MALNKEGKEYLEFRRKKAEKAFLLFYESPYGSVWGKVDLDGSIEEIEVLDKQTCAILKRW